MVELMLKLYIVNESVQTKTIIQNIKDACNKDLKLKLKLKVINILEEPHLAMEDRILATPTIIKEQPPPIIKLVGDLSDIDKVINGLELKKLE
jgi:circadian clock protein KaiB